MHESIEKKKDCDHDFKNAKRVSRADWRCPKCGKDIFLYFLLAYEAGVDLLRPLRLSSQSKNGEMTGLELIDRISTHPEKVEEYRGVKGYFSAFSKGDKNCYGWVAKINEKWYGDYITYDSFPKEFLMQQFKIVVDKIINVQPNQN